MKCKKCGKRLRKNEKFCTNCGFYNGNIKEEEWDEEEADLLKEEIIEIVEEEEEEEKEEKNPNNKEKTKEEFYYKNENFLEAYIGEDYKLIKKSPFNIWAFLLNWMYFLYRKLYITGIIGLIVTAIILIFYTKYFLIYASITMILLGFLFNRYYIFIAKKRVEVLLKKFEGTDNFTLINICKEKGGINIILTLIIYSLFLIVIFLNIITIRINKNHNTKFWNENSENQATCMSLVKTAYTNVSQNFEVGTIKEGACKIQKLTTKKYEIFLKTEKDGNTIYTYYATENDYLVYKNSTEKIKELESKKLTSSLSAEEETILKELKNIETNFTEISKKAKQEDELIIIKKNKEEKKNFIFTQEEIIR